MINRRDFLVGLGAILASGIAPALPRGTSMMRIVPRDSKRIVTVGYGGDFATIQEAMDAAPAYGGYIVQCINMHAEYITSPIVIDRPNTTLSGATIWLNSD